MALKRINQTPTIQDTIIFDIATPDALGCFNSAEYQSVGGPYKVDKVVIYKIDITQNEENPEEYDIYSTSPDLLQQLESAKLAYCNSPTEENLLTLNQIEEKILLESDKNTIFYKSTTPIAIFGTDEAPAWSSIDPTEGLITLIDEDAEGNPQYGHFELKWEPYNAREGDYFICWTWTPNMAGDSLSAHSHFVLFGSTQLTTSIPSHYTAPKKYETLLDRYLPEIYKITLSDSDLTPKVIHEFNAAVAKEFTFLEDFVNQIVDLQDANSIHESMLPLLSNLFNLKLKSNDPTLWRAQIKRAIPLFKKKGTFSGLQEAFSLAGMSLTKFTRLWQIFSLYTWQEVFDVVDEDNLTFTLEKNAILPIDPNNCEVYYRKLNSTTWETVNCDYLEFNSVNGETIITWVGHLLSFNPVILEHGDSIRVVYMFNQVPDSSSQLIEDYVRSLPLIDSRDERSQECPLKNWNARAIEEDDPMFSVVIYTRHPYYNPLIYGKVRTEFPYSENVYNSEEYNGSTRESTDPCDIDCDFLDPCSYCQSSKYTVDLEIDKLSNDRILETQEILKEFTPFHAVPHSINFSGTINEYVATPQETIELLIHKNIDEFMVSGGGQMIFMRTMDLTKTITREDLAIKTVSATDTGTTYNDNVVLYSPDSPLIGIGLNYISDDVNPGVRYNNLLEVLAPSVNAGEYTVSNPDLHHAAVSGIIGESPLNTKEFTFRVSNEIYYYTPVGVSLEFSLKDNNVNFSELNVKSAKDVAENTNHIDSDGAWKVKIEAYSATPYIIKELLPDGTLILEDTLATLPISEITNISYTLYDGSNVIKATSSTGQWLKTGHGILDISSDATLTDVRDVFKIGDYVKLPSGNQYQISGYVFDETHLVYLSSYTGAALSGIAITCYRRLLDGLRGYFQYTGLKLQTTADYESSLGILNGANAPIDPDQILENNSFKENYLILIGTDYYSVAQWDGTTITLNGPPHNWKTLSAGGTLSAFSILHYEKQATDIAARPDLTHPIDGYYFGELEATSQTWESDKLDRGDNETINISIEQAPTVPLLAHLLNSNKSGNQAVDVQGQEENVSYTIEWAGE